MDALCSPIKPAQKPLKRFSFTDYQNLTKDLEETRAAAYAELCEALEKHYPQALGHLQDITFLAYFVHRSQSQILEPPEINTARFALKEAKRRAGTLLLREESNHDK